MKQQRQLFSNCEERVVKYYSRVVPVWPIPPLFEHISGSSIHVNSTFFPAVSTISLFLFVNYACIDCFKISNGRNKCLSLRRYKK